MNLNEIAKQAQAMQEKLQKAADEIKNISATGKAGGTNGVEVTLNGAKKILNIHIPKELEGEVDIIKDLIIAAHNDAHHKIDEASQKKINDLGAGMGVSPDFLKNLGG